MSAPTIMEACLRVKRGIPLPARSRSSVITGRHPPTVVKEKGAKSDGADRVISGGSTTPSFGDVMFFFPRKEKQSAQSGASPCKIVFGRDEQIETFSNSGVSPDKISVGPALPPAQKAVLMNGGTTVSYQQLDCTPQAEPTTEESLRFARAQEALGKHISGHTIPKDDTFAKKLQCTDDQWAELLADPSIYIRRHHHWQFVEQTLIGSPVWRYVMTIPSEKWDSLA